MMAHGFHLEKGGRFTSVNGEEVVDHYGDPAAEYYALTQSTGLLDLSFRGRLCLTGADRVRFLHGQVTNDIKALREGQGCYAAIVNAKGRMEADANVYCLKDELLLDLEPGYITGVITRLEKYLVADDVQVVPVSELYALLSLQGPGAEKCLSDSRLVPRVPSAELQITNSASEYGELYAARHSRASAPGFDLFIPAGQLQQAMEDLLKVVAAEGGRLAGWNALEMARIEAGIPRYGADMDQTNFPQEAAIEGRAVSYSKGCYIGQEVLNRIHTMGHVNRTLCGLRFTPETAALPTAGEKIFLAQKEVGQITSAVSSLRWKTPIALAYLRKEAAEPASSVVVRTAGAELKATLSALPFA